MTSFSSYYEVKSNPIIHGKGEIKADKEIACARLSDSTDGAKIKQVNRK